MMRLFLGAISAVFFASGAMAQTPATIGAPTAPVAPTVTPVTPTLGGQAAPAEAPNSPQLPVQLQQALHSKNSAQAMQQGFAVATLLGCTSKQAGQQQTQAFYTQMQTVGKQVSAYCKSQQAPQARALVLATVKQNQANPVVIGATHCYDTEKASLDMMAGQELAGDFARYNRWLHDPAAAEREMKDSDICK